MIWAEIWTAQNVVVNVVPDPGTTVIGRVIDRNGLPVAGATVSFNSLSTTSAIDGTFSLPGVPTAQGNIVITASAIIAGKSVRGRSAPTAPVPSGTTNVGDIRVTTGKIALLNCDRPALFAAPL